MKDEVRILLVGESGVGKTSLILSLISEEFPEQVPLRADEITIPAEVTPERIPTQIVDYSEKEQSNEELILQIQRASVLCIVYSVQDPASINKISSYWIPLIQSSCSNVSKPIVLVGNKSDMLESCSMDLIMPIMNKYVEIETCVECSAKTLKNISEVFYYAQKAVLHPTAPLYSSETKELTPKCRQALIRIFKICDRDNDGLLNDEEIYQFQRRCFNVPLQPQALEDVKSVVRKQIKDGVQHGYLTQIGFLFLHSLFIQRGRHETTWAVLRKFGYDDDLQVKEQFSVPSLKVYAGSTTELSNIASYYLSELFEKYDDDYDGCLSPTELTNLISLCPHLQFPLLSNTVPTNSHGWITHQGFLAYWNLTTLNNVSKTLEFLAYTGFLYENDHLLTSINKTRDKRIDIEKRQTSRKVFKCLVIGAKGSGKTCFLQGLLNRNLQYLKTLEASQLPNQTVNVVNLYGHESYLILEEMEDVEETFQKNLQNYDVICLLYDVSDNTSFSYCANIYLQHLSNTWLPVCVVGTKGDLEELQQAYYLQPAEFCQMQQLPQPLIISCSEKINKHVYNHLATLSAYPHTRKLRNHSTLYTWLGRGLIVSFALTLGFIIIRFARKPQY